MILDPLTWQDCPGELPSAIQSAQTETAPARGVMTVLGMVKMVITQYVNVIRSLISHISKPTDHHQIRVTGQT